jgi:hypothetical protein
MGRPIEEHGPLYCGAHPAFVTETAKILNILWVEGMPKRAFAPRGLNPALVGKGLRDCCSIRLRVWRRSIWIRRQGGGA